MKKGDLKRNSILEAAEKLFFQKGYDQTSVQDILDELSLSKGGFYHHFASKEAILSEICENRVNAGLSSLKWELFGARTSATDKLNLLLEKLNLLNRDEPAFAAILLKVCYVDQDVRIRDRIHTAVMEQLSPLVQDVIVEGMQSEEFFVRNPSQLSDIVLGLADQAHDFACRILAANPDNPECIIEIAEKLNACRDAVEVLLGATYGSIMLFHPARLVSDYRAAANELLRLEGK